MSSEPTIARPLGKMEGSLWFCDQCSPTNIGLGAELHGTVTDDALRRALRWCQLRYPILRSVVRRAGKRVAFACYEPATAPAIPLAIGSGTAADLDPIVEEEMRQRLDGTQGLLARVRLVRLAADHSFLLLVFNHMAGDGFSAALFIQDIVNFLGRLARDGRVPDPQPLPFPPPSEEGIPADHRGFAGFKKLMAFQKKFGAGVQKHGAKPSPVRVQANPPWAERRIKTRNFSLTEAETRAFVARAKEEKVSTFALLSALLLDALHPLLQVTNPKKPGVDRVVSFAAPVDLRPFLTSSVKEQFGFYSSAINQLCVVKENNDLIGLARELNGGLKESLLGTRSHLHSSPMFASFLGWRWLFPQNEKGVAKVAKMTDNMFRSVATSLTFLNDSLTLEPNVPITMSRPRGHISPSIMGVGLFCVLLYKDILSVHLNYNEGQLSETDARLVTERLKGNLLALDQAVSVA